ncbi:MAG: hypothetical protein HYV46_15470 [candidate division NC10 bacterium]|nr:hypothetical protein [candidate division NC10 bacterium]MBI2457524.1 hypothetical protein [candidate division NC10 bacterium]
MNHDALLRQIAEMTENLSDEEFHRLMGFLGAEYRTRMLRAAKHAALTLRPADWVETLQPGRHLARGARGRVLHFARSRIHVDFAEQGIWALLPAIVKKLEPGPEENDLQALQRGR